MLGGLPINSCLSSARSYSTAVLGGMTMQRKASIRPFADVDTLPNQVNSVPGPAQALPHSSPDGIPETSTYVVDAPRKAWKRSPIKTLPIGDAMLSCIAGAVDISFQQHNRTNGSTVSLIHGSMVG